MEYLKWEGGKSSQIWRTRRLWQGRFKNSIKFLIDGKNKFNTHWTINILHISYIYKK